MYLSNQFIKPIIPLLLPDWHIVKSWEESEVTDVTRISALATTVWDKIDSTYLTRFPNLKLICHLGIGTDNIDLAYVQQKQINLLSQPDAGVHDTAELALTLMLTLARKIRLNDLYARNNEWIENKPRFLGNHLKHKQLGLVGMGKIGSTIAHFAQAFEMNIAYTSRTRRNNNYTYYSNINDLALASDVLIVCCSGGNETKNLINAAILSNLGPEGYLINVARGSIVDEQALIDALTKKQIAGAGLDVYSQEPEIALALRNLDNVILSPHMGSSTRENLDAMFALQAQQLNHYLRKAMQPVTA